MSINKNNIFFARSMYCREYKKNEKNIEISYVYYNKNLDISPEIKEFNF